MKLQRQLTLMAITIMVLVLAGCPQGKFEKAAALSKHFAATLSAVQDEEISLHAASKVSDAEHQAIQGYILQAAESGKKLDHAINVLHSGVDATAALNSSISDIDDLLDKGIGNIKNPETRAQAKLAVLAAKNILLDIQALAK